jgi:hypothetical protein
MLLTYALEAEVRLAEGLLESPKEITNKLYPGKLLVFPGPCSNTSITLCMTFGLR